MLNLQSTKLINISLPTLYRYMDKKYSDLFFEEGIIRISSFERFRKYPDEIRGDLNEGGGTYETYSKEGTQNLIMTNAGQSAYMLCSSLHFSKDLMNEFKVDSCIRIKDPVSFVNAILNAIPGTIEAFLGFCNYKDYRVISKIISPFSDLDDLSDKGTITIGGPNFNARVQETIGNGMDLMFLKEIKYQTQNEFRFVWKIDNRYFEMEDYIDIRCKEAIQYCEIVDH